jgi:hypothetical protein
MTYQLFCCASAGNDDAMEVENGSNPFRWEVLLRQNRRNAIRWNCHGKVVYYFSVAKHRDINTDPQAIGGSAGVNIGDHRSACGKYLANAFQGATPGQHGAKWAERVEEFLTGCVRQNDVGARS